MLAALVLPFLAASLALQDEAERARWKELAARCGTELDWAADWDAAAARARAAHEPVLVVAWLYPGFDLADGSQTAFAMDRDVIELVRERCVPLRLTQANRAALAERVHYGLSPTAFGAGLLLFTPDGDLLEDCPFLEPEAAYDFLCAQLDAHPELAGPPVPPELTREERAGKLLARGELKAAARLLHSPTSARGFLDRARLLRRRHDVEGALAALEQARRHQPGELMAGIELEALAVEALEARPAALRAACERLTAFSDRDEARAGEYTLGFLDLAAGDQAGAVARWRALADAHPESRWAALAAAALLRPAAELAAFRLVAPAEDVREALREVKDRPAGGTASAASDGLRWLGEHRRADGGWPDPIELELGARPDNAISAAIDALGLRALLAHRARAELDVQHEAHLALTAAHEQLAARSSAPSYMTYEVWSDAVMLELIADLLAAPAEDSVPADELRAVGAEYAQDLARRQRENGGWSYFETTSLAQGAAKLEQSISFVTASVVLALVRAHEAGIAVDEEVLATGVDALEAFRSEEGVFAYMLWSFQPRAPAEKGLAGAAGRAPLCELALLCAGRSDETRLAAALEQFFAHADSLAAERGKALMHCGAEGQGCHYVLYDYATAARAIAALPAERQAPYRTRLLALLDAARRADGSYLDTQILGPACGTALALLALAELGERP